jgi:glycosyltransferase involved in cell wall biosynthesis
MPSPPSIAVITPVRNGLPLLLESLESIRAQRYNPLEVIIVDDGSTDGTRDYLRSLKPSFCRSLELDGRGPSAARNAAIRAASSEFIAFLDADDLWPHETDLTGHFCTSRIERLSTRKGAENAKEDVHAGADRGEAAAD